MAGAAAARVRKIARGRGKRDFGQMRKGGGFFWHMRKKASFFLVQKISRAKKEFNFC